MLHFLLVCCWNGRELNAILDEHKAQLDPAHMDKWHNTYTIIKVSAATNLAVWRDNSTEGFAEWLACLFRTLAGS